MIESEMTLQYWLLMGGEQAQTLYSEWLESPMTQRVIACQRFESRPEPAPVELLKEKPLEVTLAKHSEFIGMHRVLDNMQLALLRLPQPVPEREESTYGAEETMDEEHGEGFFDREDG